MIQQSNKQTIRLLTSQALIHAAYCVLDEYLQDNETDYVYGEMKKSPPKLIQDILAARAKLHNSVDRLMPDFSCKQVDFLNQLSYLLEDLYKETYKVYVEDGTLMEKASS